MTDNRIMIVVDEDTAYAIRDALECYARLGMGQVQFAVELARPDVLTRNPWPKVKIEPPIEQFGISGAPSKARSVFDVYQHLRYALHTNRCSDLKHLGRRCMSVDHDPPLPTRDPNTCVDVAWVVRDGPDAGLRSENYVLRNFVRTIREWVHGPESERRTTDLAGLLEALDRELSGGGDGE